MAYRELDAERRRSEQAAAEELAEFGAFIRKAEDTRARRIGRAAGRYGLRIAAGAAATPAAGLAVMKMIGLVFASFGHELFEVTGLESNVAELPVGAFSGLVGISGYAAMVAFLLGACATLLGGGRRFLGAAAMLVSYLTVFGSSYWVAYFCEPPNDYVLRAHWGSISMGPRRYRQ